MAYVGEGDDVSKLLHQHARSQDQKGRDFWDRAIVITSKNTNLTKAHARYLESRFITLARQAKRAKLLNSTNPAPITLPEADVSDMEYFIEQAKIVLPVLGVNIVRSAATAAKSSSDSDGNLRGESPIFELRVKKDGIVAAAQEVDGEFTVLAGSSARMQWIGGEGHGYVGLRKRLETDGILVPLPDSKTMHFTHDEVFASPSAAAAAGVGRASNGRNEWVARDTLLTFGEWQDRQVEDGLEAVPATAD